MPTTIATDRVAPRSAIRHRPIAPTTGAAAEEPLVIPHFTRVPTPPLCKPQGKSVGKVTKALPVNHVKSWTWVLRQQHPLVLFGIGMLLAMVMVSLGQFAVSWLGTTWDDIHYGRPRTFQTDAFVGHELGKTPSHFIALNLHGRIEVIEFPGGDGAHAKIYLGPQLYDQDAELIPVTIQFIDTRHDHHPDMLILFHSSQMLFHNTQGTFQPG